jgi:glycosyltransferase involved in cell wall biosynthesis
LQRGISIIICCYNSAAILPETLKHIAFQKMPEPIGWEVIVVDNNSTDRTAGIAINEWGKYSIDIPFKVLQESRMGLIYARKSGVAAAKYDIILFCDDDNWLSEHYVFTSYERMIENNNIGILAGSSIGFFASPQPSWFSAFEKAYAIGKPLTCSGIANDRGYLAGAGMVIRKDIFMLLHQLSFEFILTGRKGEALSSGEDAELSLLTLFLGYDLYYDESLYFTHYMPAKRLQWAYCVHMMSRGHALPQIALFFYRYCYYALQNKQPMQYKATYRIALRRGVRKTLSHFKGIQPALESIRLLLVSKPGSKKEIHLKAELNRLIFMLLHKKKLQQQFQQIAAVMPQLMHMRKNVVTQAV